jgi:hypothetical protein
MALFERISRVRSGRSLSYDGESSASVGTFEFDMDMVRDSQKQRKERRGRKGRREEARDLEDGGGSSEKDPVSNAPLDDVIPEDDDTEVPLLNDSSGRTPNDSGRSGRSFVYRGSSIVSSASSGLSNILPNRTMALASIIGLLGIVSSTLFLGFGIGNAVDDQGRMFTIRANELTQEFNRTWNEYMVASLWVHQACALNNISRVDFTHVYHYLSSTVDVVVRVRHVFFRMFVYVY